MLFTVSTPVYDIRRMDVQLPAVPIIVLSLVTYTFAAPLMAPRTTMILAPRAPAAAES